MNDVRIEHALPVAVTPSSRFAALDARSASTRVGNDHALCDLR